MPRGRHGRDDGLGKMMLVAGYGVEYVTWCCQLVGLVLIVFYWVTQAEEQSDVVVQDLTVGRVTSAENYEKI